MHIQHKKDNWSREWSFSGFPVKRYKYEIRKIRIWISELKPITHLEDGFLVV